jgi:hypothetical protein
MMAVPMMKIRIMWVLVSQHGVLMGMGVRFSDVPRVGVLMMFIMGVCMIMRHCFMGVIMFMPFCQMQPKADGH